MLRIGLTGGIAAGKSVVARRLEGLGAVLVDADVLARRVVEPGSEGLQQVADAFGPEILAEDGSLDRPALGRVIFGDAAARERLNAIIHPRVRSASASLIVAAPEDAIVVEDIPLLVETGQAARFHLVIVVDAPHAERVRRMIEHRGMDESDAEQRIDAQVPGPERLREADAVLSNAGTADQLLAAVDALWRSRILPFAADLATGQPAVIAAVRPMPSDMALEGTSDLPRRVRAKIEAALPEGVQATCEPLDEERSDDVTTAALRIVVREADHEDVAAALAAAGFPQRDPGSGLHRGSDPATSVDVRVVLANSRD